MRKYFFATAMMICFIGAVADKTKQQSDTLVVTTTPKMSCSGCENRIKQNIRFVKGTKKIDASAAKQKVTIVYARGKAKYEDYVKAFKQIGYEITPVR